MHVGGNRKSIIWAASIGDICTRRGIIVKENPAIVPFGEKKRDNGQRNKGQRTKGPPYCSRVALNPTNAGTIKKERKKAVKGCWEGKGGKYNVYCFKNPSFFDGFTSSIVQTMIELEPLASFTDSSATRSKRPDPRPRAPALSQ